ncbi:hypothetical protein K9L67_05895 [Candidatus Woesearchaeota archaeon]|nr:hypothetical protein [Candidatus Woesearchaeota archaeon]MCF7901726.1 hypothetical protein [Candidatus Woesearchaeota archaeon]MCF8014078.1 hypothetical protein [Candidatus Woesearchaeota archaeon]
MKKKKTNKKSVSNQKENIVDSVSKKTDEDLDLAQDDYYSQKLDEEVKETPKKKGFFESLLSLKKKEKNDDVESNSDVGNKDSKSLSGDDVSNIRKALGLDQEEAPSKQKEFEDKASDLDSFDADVDLSDISNAKEENLTPLNEEFSKSVANKKELDESWVDHSEDILLHKNDNSEIDDTLVSSVDEDLLEEDAKEEDIPFHEDLEEENLIETVEKDQDVVIPDVHFEELERAASIDKQDLLDAVHSVISGDEDQEKLIKKINREVTKLFNDKKKEFSKVVKESVKELNKKSTELNKKIKENKKLVNQEIKEKKLAKKEQDSFKVKLSELKRLEKIENKLKSRKDKYKEDIDNLKGRQKKIKDDILELQKEKKLYEEESSKAEKLFEVKMKRFEEEMSKSKKKLADVDLKSKKLLDLLNSKEEELKSREESLNKLVEEERRILSMIDSREAPSLSNDVQDEDVFHQKISDCRQLIEEGELDDAKLLYNELVEEYVHYDVDGSYKIETHEALKDLYENINVAIMRR